MELNRWYRNGPFPSASEYPQDLVHRFPPRQEGKSIHSRDRFSAFAFSLRGASHLKSGAPCQDFSDIREIDGDWMVAAIADGVGSCKLSHWGAYIAVDTACNYIVSQMKRPLAGRTEGFIRDMMDKAFSMARQRVEEAADHAEVTVGNLQSTLTVALYNTEGTLYFCHIGDSGIVAQKMDGTVSLITPRMKGEEASSVYPLQSGTWEHGRKTSVAAFVMATDGVLDQLALNLPRMSYFGQIYYPTMEPAVYNMQVSRVGEQSDRARSVMTQYRDLLESADYRKRVSDDITFVAAISQRCLALARHPQFDSQIWEQEVRKVREWQRQIDSPIREENPPGKAPEPPSLQTQRRSPRESAARAEAASAQNGSRQDKGKRLITLVLIILCVALASGIVGFAVGSLLGISGRPKEDTPRRTTGRKEREASSQTTDSADANQTASENRPSPAEDVTTQPGTTDAAKPPNKPETPPVSGSLGKPANQDVGNTDEQIIKWMEEAQEQQKAVAGFKKTIVDLLEDEPASTDPELNRKSVQAAIQLECDALHSAIEVNRLACRAIERMHDATIEEAGQNGPAQSDNSEDEASAIADSIADEIKRENLQSELEKENKRYTQLCLNENTQENFQEEFNRLDQLVKLTMEDIENIRLAVKELEQTGGDNSSLPSDENPTLNT